MRPFGQVPGHRGRTWHAVGMSHCRTLVHPEEKWVVKESNLSATTSTFNAARFTGEQEEHNPTASRTGFEPAASTVTGWRALQTAPPRRESLSEPRTK